MLVLKNYLACVYDRERVLITVLVGNGVFSIPIGCPGFFSNKELKMKTALILIDIQNGYFPSGPLELKGITEATEKAANLLGLFRVNR